MTQDIIETMAETIIKKRLFSRVTAMTKEQNIRQNLITLKLDNATFVAVCIGCGQTQCSPTFLAMQGLIKLCYENRWMSEAEYRTLMEKYSIPLDKKISNTTSTTTTETVEIVKMQKQTQTTLSKSKNYAIRQQFQNALNRWDKLPVIKRERLYRAAALYPELPEAQQILSLQKQETTKRY